MLLKKKKLLMDVLSVSVDPRNLACVTYCHICLLSSYLNVYQLGDHNARFSNSWKFPETIFIFNFYFLMYGKL